jgi:uncharacterized protein YwgA
MPFIERNSNGKITTLFREAQYSGQEELPPSNEEVLAFLLENESDSETKAYLSKTDAEMVRIVEDLVDLLIQKNLILLTDLPAEAQKKLMSRKRIRAKFQTEDSLLIDESAIL